MVITGTSTSLPLRKGSTIASWPCEWMSAIAASTPAQSRASWTPQLAEEATG
jgi:hypothetical protein